MDLFFGPVGHRTGGSSSFVVVVDFLVFGAGGDEHDVRVTLQAESLVELPVHRRIDLRNLGDTFELGGQLRPLRPEGLAVPAPGCIQLQQPGVLIRVDGGLEGVLVDDDDVLFGGAVVDVLLCAEGQRQKSS